MNKQVGKYVLERELGRGAMGSVWLSRHPGLGIPVAVKVLDEYLAAQDPDFYNRFVKEGTLAASINHHNVVRVYDAGRDGNTFFLVMELVDGQDAGVIVKERGMLSVDEVLDLAIASTEGLKEAHGLGVVHRDIKPDNIMVTQSGTVKLADLGIAKQVNDNYSSTITGTAIGTPYYIAPEQAVDASTVDQRCDIYSLGATLYHLLTGQVPFEGSSAMSILMKHTTEPLVHPKKIRPDLPKNICNVICKMMEKDPNDRYSSCDELLKDLHGIKFGATDQSKSKKVKHFKAPTRHKVTKDNLENELGDVKSLSKAKSKKTKKKKNSALLYCAVTGVPILILIVVLISFSKGKDKKIPPKKDPVVAKKKTPSPKVEKVKLAEPEPKKMKLKLNEVKKDKSAPISSTKQSADVVKVDVRSFMPEKIDTIQKFNMNLYEIMKEAKIYNNHKYFHIKHRLHYDDATLLANTFGAHLATIKDKNELIFLNQSFDSEKGFWLGATDRNLDRKWEWVTGEAISDYKTRGTINGPFLSIKNHEYRAKSTNSTLSSLIEWDLPTREFIRHKLQLNRKFLNDKFRPQMKEEFVKFRDHYYLFVPMKMGWTAAQKFAQKFGAHLVNITSSDERDFLQEYIKGIPVWTGGKRVSKEQWCWANGERWGYNEWDPDYPRNVVEYSNISLSWKKSEYRAYPANLKLMFVLEWDK